MSIELFVSLSIDLDLHPDLHLPKPNLFIATDFSLKAPDLPSTKVGMAGNDSL